MTVIENVMFSISVFLFQVRALLLSHSIETRFHRPSKPTQRTETPAGSHDRDLDVSTLLSFTPGMRFGIPVHTSVETAYRDGQAVSGAATSGTAGEG